MRASRKTRQSRGRRELGQLRAVSGEIRATRLAVATGQLVYGQVPTPAPPQTSARTNFKREHDSIAADFGNPDPSYALAALCCPRYQSTVRRRPSSKFTSGL